MTRHTSGGALNHGGRALPVGQGRFRDADASFRKAAALHGEHGIGNGEALSLSGLGEADRFGLERLAQYAAKPGFALGRLERVDQDTLIYRLPRPAHDGSTFVTMTPLELIHRLTHLVPAPHKNTLHYCGVFSGNARLRTLVTASAGPAAAMQLQLEQAARAGVAELDPQVGGHHGGAHALPADDLDRAGAARKVRGAAIVPLADGIRRALPLSTASTAPTPKLLRFDSMLSSSAWPSWGPLPSGPSSKVSSARRAAAGAAASRSSSKTSPAQRTRNRTGTRCRIAAISSSFCGPGNRFHQYGRNAFSSG